jgi:hypothetical protein
VKTRSGRAAILAVLILSALPAASPEAQAPSATAFERIDLDALRPKT